MHITQAHRTATVSCNRRGALRIPLRIWPKGMGCLGTAGPHECAPGERAGSTPRPPAAANGSRGQTVGRAIGRIRSRTSNVPRIAQRKFGGCAEFIIGAKSPWHVHAECMNGRSYRAQLGRLDPCQPRVLVWGDGSFERAEGLAGSAFFYGGGSVRNRCFRCPDPPCNDRAKLFAFLQLLEQEQRPLIYCTDSTYVHDGFTELRDRRRARAWFRRPHQAELVPNADLWQRVDTLVRRRTPDAVLTCWGRGHARLAQAYAGETSDLLCFGNVCSDRLAAHGARLLPGCSSGVPHILPV